MQAFVVRLPSGQRYWTVLDEDLQVHRATDAFLQQVRFGDLARLNLIKQPFVSGVHSSRNARCQEDPGQVTSRRSGNATAMVAARRA
jgi:hypothetical protein